MAGLLDLLNAGNGLLALAPGSFANRWAGVDAALAAGSFDPQGQNNPPGAGAPAMPNNNVSAMAPGFPPVPLPLPRPAAAPMPAAAMADAAGAGGLPPDFWARFGQGLSDNANTLLALGGGTLRGGIGMGAQDAARIGLHEAELAQRRRAAAAQQAATVAALRSLGLGNPAALAAMNPVLARALISRGERR
jgi:hypothetical protein